MIPRLRRAFFVLALLAASRGEAAAVQAPRIAASIAAGANDLQRAAWACEAGAPSLVSAQVLGPSGVARYILSGAGESGAAEPPLVLGSGKLSGFGWLSDDRGWSVIRFQCVLAKDLRRATAFSYTVLAKAGAPTGDPTAPEVAPKSGGRAKAWAVASAMATLSHGIDQTDDRDFRADCIPHSGRASLVLNQTVPWLKKDGFVVVSLGDGARSALYVARARYDEATTKYVPEISLAADDSLFDWIGSAQTLFVNIGRDLAYSLPLAGAAEPAGAFAAVCRQS